MTSRGRAASAALVLLSTACGGGAPLFHGAHALSTGSTAEGAGFSGTFAFGGAQAATRAPQSAERTAALDALAPRVAPWVNARVGLGKSNEAGLTYTGRAIRFDARHAFEDDEVALSVGAGASWVLRGSDNESGADHMGASPGGYGFDIPVLFGWRSDAGIVRMWVGPRVGAERLSADSATTGDLDLRRWYAGAVFGFGLGFRHVHAALEIDAYHQDVKGSVGDEDVHLSGLTVAPGAGLIFSF